MRSTRICCCRSSTTESSAALRSRYDLGMSVRVFYDEYRVEQLRQAGIRAPRQSTREPVPDARTALELVEENARLRAEVARLRDEVARLTAAAPRVLPPDESDDAVTRFSLLELDL